VVGVAVVVVVVKVDVAYETLVVERAAILEVVVYPVILEVEVIPEILAFASVVSPEMLVLFKVMFELMAVAVLEVEVAVCSNTVSETMGAAEKLATGVSRISVEAFDCDDVWICGVDSSSEVVAGSSEVTHADSRPPSAVSSAFPSVEL
jgi:hypothetical protein